MNKQAVTGIIFLVAVFLTRRVDERISYFLILSAEFKERVGGFKELAFSHKKILPVAQSVEILTALNAVLAIRSRHKS